MSDLVIPRTLLRLSMFIPLIGFSGSACNDEPAPAVDPAAAEGPVPIVHAEEIWRSSKQLLLSGVTDLAVDSRGRVYLADRDAGIILLSPTGDSLRSIGGKGGGPGEYEFIGSLQVIDGDSLLIFDPPTRRASVFEPDSGAFAYAHTFRELPDQQWILRVARVHAEAPYVAVFPPRLDPSGQGRQSLSVVRLLDAEGRIVRDSLLVFPPGDELVASRSSGDRVVTTFRRGNPFGWDPTVRLTVDRIYYGRSDSLAIHIYDLAGNRIGGFSKSATPRPVTDEDVEGMIESMRNQEGPDPDDRGRVREQWIEQLEENVPEYWPVYRTFLVDDQGHVWLLPRWRQNDEEGRPPWSVYSPDGTLLAKVAGVFPQTFADGKAYSVRYDSLGVPTVFAFRMPDFASGTPSPH